MEIYEGCILVEFEDITGRIKSLCGFKTDRELATALEMSPSSFHNRKKANSVPYEAVFKLCVEKGLSLDQVLGLDLKSPSIRPEEREMLERFREVESQHQDSLLEYAGYLRELASLRRLHKKS